MGVQVHRHAAMDRASRAGMRPGLGIASDWYLTHIFTVGPWKSLNQNDTGDTVAGAGRCCQARREDRLEPPARGGALGETRTPEACRHSGARDLRRFVRF